MSRFLLDLILRFSCGFFLTSFSFLIIASHRSFTALFEIFSDCWFCYYDQHILCWALMWSVVRSEVGLNVALIVVSSPYNMSVFVFVFLFRSDENITPPRYYSFNNISVLRSVQHLSFSPDKRFLDFGLLNVFCCAGYVKIMTCMKLLSSFTVNSLAK